MKTVILALLVLVVLSQGEALKCKCGGPNTRCSARVETCEMLNPVCATVFLGSGSQVRYFKRCMKENDCRLLTGSSVASGTCCSTDLCNS